MVQVAMPAATVTPEEVLKAIKRHVKKTGWFPSIRLIRDLMDLQSTRPVQRCLEALVKSGEIERVEAKGPGGYQRYRLKKD